MLTFVVVLAGAVVLVGIGVLLGRRTSETPAQKYEREMRELQARDRAREILRQGGEFAEVRSLVADGKKIQAIKAFREATGCGLKEAKDAVEAMERGEE